MLNFPFATRTTCNMQYTLLHKRFHAHIIIEYAPWVPFVCQCTMLIYVRDSIGSHVKMVFWNRFSVRPSHVSYRAYFSPPLLENWKRTYPSIISAQNTRIWEPFFAPQIAIPGCLCWVSSRAILQKIGRFPFKKKIYFYVIAYFGCYAEPPLQIRLCLQNKSLNSSFAAF